MKSNQKQNKNEEGELRVELKYCERCGGLWLRECGVGVVYCANCEREVADLPVPKKKPQRVRMPALPQSVAEDYRFGREPHRLDENAGDDSQNNDSQNNDSRNTGSQNNDGRDLEASGGAA